MAVYSSPVTRLPLPARVGSASQSESFGLWLLTAILLLLLVVGRLTVVEQRQAARRAARQLPAGTTWPSPGPRLPTANRPLAPAAY